MKIGLDIGSTTLKCIILDDADKILFKSYKRHSSRIGAETVTLLRQIRGNFPDREHVHICVSGSAGMGLANRINIPFVQEVYAAQLAVNKKEPGTDVVIELGGEDSKALFLSGSLEVRMNGSCAGGTGAFIDQMCTLLDITPGEMNEAARLKEKTHIIASRCDVFAKTDIQSLINQGAKIPDISASIFSAVVNQTITALAQGREIKGKVLYLGGPLTFLSELRKCFDQAICCTGICPDNSLYFAAYGAAIYGCENEKEVSIPSLLDAVESRFSGQEYTSSRRLFTNSDEYDEFVKRHKQHSVKFLQEKGSDHVDHHHIKRDQTKCAHIEHGHVDHGHIECGSTTYNGDAYIGIDAGSTTVKAVVIDENEYILHSAYMPNNGNPVGIVRDFLTGVYEKFPNIVIRSSASTGYGEEIVKSAFQLDYGVVETMAHYIAAKKFCPSVDFIVDIGGQDIKCMTIKNGAIDNIFLNEACSSGCGSFLQTFAQALGYNIEEFARSGIFADRPADLGSRCTVFMNSSVKQAQKEGASIENISAGLSISVVKNALYKVIRVSNTALLGKNIVVQGGTFLNDAVLRAFEQEIGCNVIRPNIAGLMGAYGAALYAKANSFKQEIECGVRSNVKRSTESQVQSSSRNNIGSQAGTSTKTSVGTSAGDNREKVSSILSGTRLNEFRHEVRTVNCGLCGNNCQLTINTFEGNRKFIGGNRCEKPLAKESRKESYNLYRYKLSLLGSYRPVKGKRGSIGIPMGLNMYELLPFWHTFLTSLGFEVVLSPLSTRELYLEGQHSIPSDTICYPAKLLHGHIEFLVKKKVPAIFYPCMSYNLDEGLGDNYYNCPIVAYYPEVIAANVPSASKTKFIYNYVGIHRKRDFIRKIQKILWAYFEKISFAEVKKAAKRAFGEYGAFLARVREKGRYFLRLAAEKGLPVIVLAGRPYHLDPEINHGIDQLICNLGAVVLTEDSVSGYVEKFPVNVLNQWTYHARLYAAAKYIADKPNINLVQLVSL
jgi:predicted CoA-substrate-specific enzyme activase